MVWQTATNHIVQGVDTNQNGYVIAAQYLTSVDAYSPLLLFDKNGVDQCIDFTFSVALGDTKVTAAGSNMADCRFSYDGNYVYLIQSVAAGADDVRVHKYDLEGNRLWRVAFPEGRYAADTLAIDSNEYIYIPYGGGANNKSPVRLDPSDGSIDFEYSSFESLAVNNCSCISIPLNKVYFGTADTPGGSTVPDTTVYGLSLSSNSYVTYVEVGSHTRQICTDHTSVFAYGVNGGYDTNNIKKLNGTTLALEAQTNVTNACRLWYGHDGNIWVGVNNASINDSIVVLNPSNLAVVTTYSNTNGNWCQGNGLGQSRRAAWVTLGDDPDTSTTYTQYRNLWFPSDYAHLEGEELQVLADGAVHPNVTVSNGSVTLNDTYTTTHIGLRYDSRLQPMKLDGEAQLKHIYKIFPQLFETLGGKYGEDADSLYTIIFRDAGDELNDSADLFTGHKELPFDGSWDRKGDLWMEQEQPLPMNVLGIGVKANYGTE
jgi:hypothetical protein